MNVGLDTYSNTSRQKRRTSSDQPTSQPVSQPANEKDIEFDRLEWVHSNDSEIFLCC